MSSPCRGNGNVRCLFRERSHGKLYLCLCARGAAGGFLHTTSERGEGYIAYKPPKEKIGLKTM